MDYSDITPSMRRELLTSFNSSIFSGLLALINKTENSLQGFSDLKNDKSRQIVKMNNLLEEDAILDLKIEIRGLKKEIICLRKEAAILKGKPNET